MARPAEERFWEKVSQEPMSGCWLWTGAVDRGYGQFSAHAGQHAKAHRFSYELLRGPIPKGLDLDHLCRVRCCVNPAHLEPVTRKENLRRSPLVPARVGGIAMGKITSARTHCCNGHEYKIGTFWSGRGYRECKLCCYESKRRRRKLAAQRELA